MDNDASVKKRALKILGNRNYSEQEMYKKLVSKGESHEDSEEAVKWLVELGYINDSDYATLIIRHYVAKGYGEARIKNELHRRGIPKEMWEEKLSIIEETDIKDAAIEFLTKKLKGSTEKDDIRRATDALIRRGYSYEDVKNAVSLYFTRMCEE